MLLFLFIGGSGRAGEERDSEAVVPGWAGDVAESDTGPEAGSVSLHPGLRPLSLPALALALFVCVVAPIVAVIVE